MGHGALNGSEKEKQLDQLFKITPDNHPFVTGNHQERA
jgi:hypothetical protein